jgi:hypothetical protein
VYLFANHAVLGQQSPELNLQRATFLQDGTDWFNHIVEQLRNCGWREWHVILSEVCSRK